MNIFPNFRQLMKKPLSYITDLVENFGKEKKSFALYHFSHSASSSTNYSQMSEVKSSKYYCIFTNFDFNFDLFSFVFPVTTSID